MNWLNHRSKPAPRVEPDEDDEDDMTVEERILEQLKVMTTQLAKLERRMDKAELAQTQTITELKEDLRQKGQYVEMLLARLLEQHTLVSTSAPVTPVKGNSKYESTFSKPSTPPAIRDNGSKLAGPVGKLP